MEERIEVLEKLVLKLIEEGNLTMASKQELATEISELRARYIKVESAT